MRESLGAVAGCLAEALGRTPNEAAIFRDYGRAVLALDEVICEVNLLTKPLTHCKASRTVAARCWRSTRSSAKV